MEAWQKGAPVVLKMSSSAKEKYFKKFPDRLEWFQRNHPEHFGHSVTQSTVTLKKATDAKVAAQKIADMRYKKALEASSERVKEMGTRRRESGEGLGGGLESNKDIVAYVRQHGSIKAGRLGGDLYEGKEMSHAKTLAEQIIARKAKELLEEPQSEADAGEYDYEGDMAKSQLRSILHNAKMLHDMLEDNTNLPEWVQSKVTLAEDYILTAANYMRGELKRMDEEVELDEESKNLRFDPEAPLRMSAPIVKMWKKSKTGDKKAAAAWAKHVRRIQKVEPEGMSKKDIEDHMQAHFGESVEIMEEDLPFEPNAKPVPKGSDMAQHGGMSRAKHLAKMALRGITQPQPASADELVAQHVSLHTPKEGEMMEEGAARKAKSNDLVKRSMLPDRSVIPAGKGFGDDIPRSKKEKIMKKIGKALQKKRMVLPTDNPSENELVPQSMLPDVPGYPEGYQMEEQVVEQPIEQQVETSVVEENASPFVSAGSKFLTRTSSRLVYGDKND